MIERPDRHRWVRCIAIPVVVCLAGAGAVAQAGLRPDPLEALHRLAESKPTDAAMVDALAASDLAWDQWSQELNSAFGPEAHREEVLARLWSAEPARRRARAAVFAQVPRLLIQRCQHAGADREDVLACAALLGSETDTVGWIRATTALDGEREACTAMLRSAAAHDRDCDDPFLAPLLLPGVERGEADALDDLLRRVINRREYPFARLARVIRTQTRFARVRSALLLCRNASLPIPSWIGREFADDPSAQVRQWFTEVPLDDTEARTHVLPALCDPSNVVEQRAAMLRAGAPDAGLSLAVRADLIHAAFAVIAAGTTEVTPIWQGGVLANLVGGEPPLAAGLLIACEDDAGPGSRTAAAIGLMMNRPTDITTRLAVADLTASLLELESPDIDLALGNTMKEDPRWFDEGPIHAVLGKRARTALEAPEIPFALFTGHGDGLFQAALRGERTLVDPMLDMLARWLGGSGSDPFSSSFAGPLGCAIADFRALVPVAEETSIRRALDLLAPFTRTAFGRCNDASKRTSEDSELMLTWCALWCLASDSLAAGLGIEGLTPGIRSQLADGLARERLLVPRPRVRALLGGVEPRRSAMRVWIRAPELVSKIWQEQPPARDEFIEGYAWLVMQDPALACAALRVGGLPRELVTRALRIQPQNTPDELARLGSLLSNADRDLATHLGAEWAFRVAQRIEHARSGTPAEDLEACTAMMAMDLPIVAIAAARRALGLGARDAALRTLAGLCGSRDPYVLDELCRVAIDLDIDFDGLADAARRRVDLKGAPPLWSWSHAVLVRSGRAPLEATPAVHAVVVIAVLKLDVDADRLRRCIGVDKSVDAALLVAHGTTPSRVSALKLAAERSEWSTQLEYDVTHSCVDPDPEVRRAVYLALRSRDRDLDPNRNLLALAWLDPVPELRALAE